MANRRKIYDMLSGHCFYCGCELDIDNFHMDHFIPKAKGGKDHRNIVPSCPDCNQAKGDLSIEEFRRKIESYMLVKNDMRGRLMRKYFHIRPIPVVFFFERIKESHGILQNYISDILE